MSYLYHGSYKEINAPDLRHTREDVDFGAGFYLTEDKNMALKWASRKSNAVLNTYTLNFEGLNVVRFGLTENWLHFVASCRGESDELFDVTGVDVIVGPTADDKMYDTLANYFDGMLTAEQAIKYLNVSGFSEQIALKTERAINQLRFVRSNTLSQNEKDFIRRIVKAERRASMQLLNEMIAADKKTMSAAPSPIKGDYENDTDPER